jgi:hypothetical protein
VGCRTGLGVLYETKNLACAGNRATVPRPAARSLVSISTKFSPLLCVITWILREGYAMQFLLLNLQ